VSASDNIIHLKGNILENPENDEIFIQNILEAYWEEKRRQDELEEKRLHREAEDRRLQIELEMERLRVLEGKEDSGGASKPGSITPKVELHKVMSKFVPQDTGAQLFLSLFESQAGMARIVPEQ
jgi:hypothetical protein